MKTTLSYIIEDSYGNILFKYPPNTLLDKITDVWPLITNYYDNYYPFSIWKSDARIYREVTVDEFKTSNFMRLFTASYLKKRIKYLSMFTGKLCIVNHPLCVGRRHVHINSSESRLEIYIDNVWVGNEINDISQIYVSESQINYNDRFYNLMVLSDVVF